jgi:tetratricopeptide (TPR) repeat protein
VVEATRETESVLQEGLQRSPEDSALQTAEAQFRELIDQHERAEQALRKAFELNPRQDWIAIRLAKKLTARGDNTGAIKLLRECLNHNPSSHAAHLEVAKVLGLEGQSGDHKLILDHLRRSFTDGDANFDAQFWYARELFITMNHSESARIFESLKHAPIDPKIRRRVRAFVREADGSIARFEGKVHRKESTYILIESPAFGPTLFGHITNSLPYHFGAAELGSRIEFGLGFSMERPEAVNVHLPSYKLPAGAAL